MHEHPSERQTGRTTKQMLEAPQGGVFVWCSSQTISYAAYLARHLGRSDLKILHPHMLEDDQIMAYRSPMAKITIDHALPEFYRNRRGFDIVREHNERCERLAR